MAEIFSVVISSRIHSISVQCVITPLIARHGARKPAQTLFSSSVRHQQQLEMLWKATPRKQRPELWPHFELCLFICSSDMNDSSVIWLVLLLYKSSYKRLSIIHFLLLFQLNVFYNVMNVRRSLRRRDIHTDEAFYLDIDVMDNEEFNVNLHICFRWAAVIYLLAPKHGIKI